MKPDAMNDDLEHLEIQPVDMQHHRTALRRTLLASPYWQKPHRGLFSKGEGIMRRRALIATGVALSIAAIALVYGLIFTPASMNTAYAAELVQKSYQAVDALPPEQQGALGGTLKVDSKELLQKAKNANDLKALTYDQFASQYPVPQDGTSNLQHLTFLQFSDADGNQFVIGIDRETNLPAFALAGRGNLREAPKQGTELESVNSGSSDGCDMCLRFQSSDNGTKIVGTINADGTATFVVNGKKYTAPAGTKFSTDTPPTVKVEGNDVYVNGTKLVPAE